MLIVNVLPDKSYRALGIILIQLGHVEIINEVNQFLIFWWPISPSCLLFDMLSHDLLEDIGIRVVVKIDILMDQVILRLFQIVQ